MPRKKRGPRWSSPPRRGSGAWAGGDGDGRPSGSNFSYVYVCRGQVVELVALRSSTSALELCRWIVRPLREARSQAEHRWWARWARRAMLAQLRFAALARYRCCMFQRCWMFMTWPMVEALGRAITFDAAVAALPLIGVRESGHLRWTSLRCCWRGCDKTFVYSGTLQVHVSRDHLHQSQQCDLCGRILHLRANLAQHQASPRCCRRRAMLLMG